MSSPWLSPLAGRVYMRRGYVCKGVFPPGLWLARPFSEHRVSGPCGFVEPPGVPQAGRGYHCPRCGGALLNESVDASFVDLVEDWVSRVDRAA